jgi:hypothetical protein
MEECWADLGMVIDGGMKGLKRKKIEWKSERFLVEVEVSEGLEQSSKQI